MATESIIANKVRSLLTMLGIIFGVSAVISMLAIGEGAQKEILEQLKLVGVNNIVIAAKKIEKEEGVDTKSAKKETHKSSRGLTLIDAKSVSEVFENVSGVSPEVGYDLLVVANGKKKQGRLVGVTPEFFTQQNLEVLKGQFFGEKHINFSKSVCVVGNGIGSKFFNGENPVGQYIKCGSIWLEIIGVIKPTYVSESASQSLGISNYDNEVFAPLQTVLIRYKNRTLVTSSSIKKGEFDGNENAKPVDVNYNQLDKIIVQVKETSQLSTTAEAIGRMMKRRHSELEDYEIKIPELLLKQQQKTKDIFNIVLGAIAGISLVVGGIGIMNIMLASVMERIKEIGVRLSLGATKKDIASQFITEAVLLSVTGGVAGIILGIVFAFTIDKVAGIATIIPFYSIVLSFFVSAGVGVLFGYMPAKRAAALDPINSLRYE